MKIRHTACTIRTKDRAVEFLNAVRRYAAHNTRKNLRRIKRAHRHMLAAPPA